MNFGSSFARAGAVVAGLVAMLHLAYPALPYFIYGFFALLAGEYSFKVCAGFKNLRF